MTVASGRIPYQLRLVHHSLALNSTRRPTTTAVVAGTVAHDAPPWTGSGRWELVATGPTPSRSGAAAVWTGRELIVWGGLTDVPEPDLSRHDYAPDYPGYTGTPSTTGAAFDPRTAQWTTIPGAPLPPLETEVSAVWTGAEVLVWGVDLGSRGPGTTRTFGALFDPSTRTWRRMADQTIVPFGTGTWTGSEFVAVGEHAATAYRPTTDSWRRLPDPPVHIVPSSSASVVGWNGTEVVVGIPDGSDAPVAFNPRTDTWRIAATSPFGSRATTFLGWTGDTLIEVGRTTASSDMLTNVPGFARYDPVRNDWSKIAEPPSPIRLGPGQSACGRLIFPADTTDRLFAYGSTTDRWETVPAPPKLGHLFCVGDTLFDVAAGGPGGDPGAVYRYPTG